MQKRELFVGVFDWTDNLPDFDNFSQIICDKSTY